ncbi:PilW family protein [Clostridium sp. LP20]|uniref:PilW family protein n=1 Tax=Clostridium sp. LP20 TaxID=3418665 RepID=UPI003EE6E59A
MKKKGFTMIELIAVMAISAIIGLAIMSLILSQNKLFFHVNNETVSQDETRLAFSVMEDDIRSGRNKVGTTLKVEEITINTSTYKLAQIDGENKGVVLCGFTRREQALEPDGSGKVDATGNPVMVDVACAYIYYKHDSSETGSLVFVRQNSAGTHLSNVTTISKDVKKAEVMIKANGEYVIDLAIKKGTAEENFKCVVTPRN